MDTEAVSPTLLRYVIRLFVSSLLLTVFIVGGLIMLFDVIELLRQTARVPEATVGAVVIMAFQRLPLMLQTALPFVFLAAAMITFWRLGRFSELIVIRASGVSIWNLLLPLLALVTAIGIATVLIGNPIAASMFKQFERSAQEFGLASDTPFSLSEGGMWLREPYDNGYTVVRAQTARQDQGTLSMNKITVIRVRDGGDTLTRIDAEDGQLRNGRFELNTVQISRPGDVPIRQQTARVPTDLSLPRIQENFAQPQTLSFWELPAFIDFFASAGFSVQAHRVHWHTMLSSPAMLAVMTLVAAVFGSNVSQRRAGWLARGVGCVVAGFLVYFFSQVTYTLGQSETLPVVMAAWSPVIVTGMLGTAVLFHIEDG